MNFFGKKTSRYKPLFKQYIKLRENVQNRDKFSKLTRKKWETQLFYYSKRLRHYLIDKPINQRLYRCPRYASLGTAFKKKYRDRLNETRKLSLYYGGITRKKIKSIIKESKRTATNIKNKICILELLESRLDTVLYRAKFQSSMRGAGQLIAHGKVSVNDKIIRNKSHLLRVGDVVKINDIKLINPLKIDILYKRKYGPQVIEVFKWGKNWGEKIFSYRWNILPIPPKHLVINYKTFQIVFLGVKNIDNLSTSYPYYFNMRNIR